ncbi:MAG: hypothetical protein QM734_14270 [Cyclobacteriaceae bacterium]
MKDKIKIGIQILHLDEFNSLTNLLAHPNIEFYSWKKHDFDQAQLDSCDFFILFARRHWRYIKYNKPYLLILADYVSNQKAIWLSMSRRLSLTGYKYSANNLFKGYLCGSAELFETVRSENILAVFYPKKYPFAEIFNNLKKDETTNTKHIVTLINNYKSTASERKWSKPQNSYKVYESISKEVTNFDFDRYGAPDNEKTFDESNKIQAEARYTIHIKYWGHVCNAVVKSLALGTPVLMDEETFHKGRYKAYLRNGENAMIFKTKEQIVNYLKSPDENSNWLKLKRTCIAEAKLWHFPYSADQKNEALKLLETFL